MWARKPRHLSVKAFLCIWMAAYLRIAVSATATATVTATIVEPIPDIGGVTISSMQLDMRRKTHDELTITNLSSNWREVRIELIAPSSSITKCGLQYSPMISSIPPDGYQVLRIFQPDRVTPCPMGYQLVISDSHAQGVSLFHVSVYTSK